MYHSELSQPLNQEGIMKTTPANDNLDELIEHSYEEAKTLHGELSLSLVTFKLRLCDVMQHHKKQKDEESDTSALSFKRLHTKDLYLAIACAQSNEDAWRRFSTLYNKPIYETALQICRNRSQADEIARSVIGHLFLPDSKGSPRIKSYSGISSLLTWLRVIITNKAVDEIRHKSRYAENYEAILEIVDETGSHGAQRTVQMALYEDLIKDVFQEAPLILSEQEKLILKLRYKNEMKMGEIAALVGASQPNLTYRIKRAHKKLKQEVVAILQKRHHLNEAAIKECIDEILENPAYSLLDFLSK
jgi:RNA polymerase sigma-70 factor, ECF subfamily